MKLLQCLYELAINILIIFTIISTAQFARGALI